MKNLVKEFKEFIASGNLVELAVAFVLGVAVAAVINSFTQDIVMQIVAAIVGQPDFSSLTIDIGDGQIRYGAFLNTLFSLIVIGLVLFVIIRVYNNYRKAKPDQVVAPTAEELLADIRDELRSQRRVSPPPPPAQG